jgi:hypothetical protein
MTSEEQPGKHYWSAISPHWLSLNESWDRGVREFLAECSQVPRLALDLYAGHWCQSEVNNGGLYQFFFNTTGLLAPEAANGFRVVGLLEWSAIVSEAMRFFGAPYPRERSTRLELLPESGGRDRQSWDPFASLDQRFYECSDGARFRWERAADAYAERAV